jgi:malonyl CoA-acyl carrier protein transacylase
MAITSKNIVIRYPAANIFDAAHTAAEAWGATVFRDAPGRGASLRSTPTNPVNSERVLFGAEWWQAGDEAAFSGIKALAERGADTWIEVTNQAEAAKAVSQGAQKLVVMGSEGGGLVGDESTLVLLRRVLGTVSEGVLVYARGGIGFDTAAACIAAGADGVVLDSQMLLASDVQLPETLRKRLEGFNPLDTVCVGPTLGFRYRLFGQVATPIVRQLVALESTSGCSRERLNQAIAESTASEYASIDVRKNAWALGQDAAFSVPMSKACGNTAGILKALLEITNDRLASTDSEWPFAAGAGIAAVNDTQFPLHQGPMAQVADCPEFAKNVVDAGSMPWLALANMPTEIAEKLVTDTAERLGGKPFGAGIIGLDANRFRDAHIEMLKKQRPPFVLVAAGTIEQAQDLEAADVKTYLHTPTPGLLRAALRGGLKRFVLEGSEAGGHVGSLGGLVLWQLGIHEIETAIEEGAKPNELSFVPAGGLGDVASTRALAAALLGLARKGVNVGLQLGTAYLMCKEAVASGAVTQVYQDVIIRSRGTTLMGETVRTPTRVLPTPQAQVVLDREVDRRNREEKLKDRKVAYEHDNFGGLRTAAKGQKIAGVDEGGSAIFQGLAVDEQLSTGLYHAGQSVALISGTTTLAELHDTMINARLSADQKPASTQNQAASASNSDNIAIIGLGAVLPDAANVEEFWNNLKTGHYAVTDVPASRWNADLVYSEDRKVPDTTYSRIGAFIKDFDFNRRQFRVPPSVVKSLDPTQQIALEAARQALEDAGVFDESNEFPTENCAIIVGNSQGGDNRTETTVRVQVPRMQEALAQVLDKANISGATADKIGEDFKTTFLADVAPITEDTMAGELPNCIAGRIASTFDLGGANWVVDAACASSLAALQVAIQGLRAGTYDAALVGGADCLMGAEAYVKFSKIGALSHDGSKPFDIGANGFVMGEGSAMFVLMREDHARARGAKIYALLRGSGASSDGRGKGITAPNPRGQERAILRAYADSGVDPQTVTMFEAHGTGTPVGDPVEVQSLVKTVGKSRYGASLGSVKSNIGHLKAAAGAAAILKTTLALHHRELVPTLNVNTVNPKLPLADGNLHLQLKNEAWDVPSNVVRRAGVSAFGFGGTNVHVVLEEALSGSQPANDYEDFMSSSEKNQGTPAAVAAAPAAPAPQAAAPAAASYDAIYETIVTVVCERTGYAADEIESDFELEADLGIDTVKQAEIMAQVRESYGLEADADFRLAEYPTLGRLADYVVERMGLAQGTKTAQDGLSIGAGATKPVASASAESDTSSVQSSQKPDVSDAGPQDPHRGQLRGILAASGTSREELASKVEGALHDLASLRHSTFNVAQLQGQHRVVVAFEPTDSDEELTKLFTKTASALRTDKGLKILANKGVHVGEGDAIGSLAFLFPGQGSQYLGMCGDLRREFPIVQKTFDEADAVMVDVLEKPLSFYMDPTNLETPADKKRAFADLTRTEITQPAMLTADIAILRLLAEFGFTPDLVAGHSLGEYGACVAAGVMDFPTALKTVAARGTEMANVEPMDGDVGLMAALGASVEQVQPILDSVDGYVVCANKNCDSQTVIGGSSPAVKAVMAKVAEAGIDGMLLPVSHAFHTRVVETASAPLKRHLASMEINVPKLPILSNVTGEYYPESTDAIVDLLSQQVAAPVEFISEIRKMYQDGARTFVEVGPKRAQTGFISNILDGQDHVAFYTNHPKFGGLTSLRRAVAQLLAQGYIPGKAVAEAVSATVSAPVKTAVAAKTVSQSLDPGSVYEAIVGVLCEQTGYAPDEIEADFELEADLGIDTVKQAEIMAKVREIYGLEADSEFRLAEYPSLQGLTEYVMGRAGGNTSPDAVTSAESTPAVEVVAEPLTVTPVAQTATATIDRDSVYEALVRIVCDKSGYAADELEGDFELEADLGIDTVKQAEIMAAAREEYGLEPDTEFRLSEYESLDKLTNYVVERATGMSASPSSVTPVTPEVIKDTVEIASAPMISAPASSEGLNSDAVYEQIVVILCEQTGYDPSEIEAEFEMEADLGIDTVKQAEIMAKVREVYALERDEDFRLSEYPTLARLTEYVLARGAVTPVAEKQIEAPKVPVTVKSDAPRVGAEAMASSQVEGDVLDTTWTVPGEIVCSGMSVGVPGQAMVFGDDVHQAIFDGKNHIDRIVDETVEAILAKNITRLEKGSDGTAQYVPIKDPAQSVHLAGQLGSFDLCEEFGIEERLRDGLDRASQLAFAAGLDALRNARIPLVPRYRTTRSGKKVTTGWALPESMRDETGIIYAACFTGIDVAIKQSRAAATDSNYTFDPRFLLQVIGMGHARFAEFIGARGPNTRINVACASTTQAIGIAEDWLRLGRCKRVIVIGADDVTEADMMEWVGSGFLATGAGTNESDVKKAALPFDKRRNGTILGAGAVGLVIEHAEKAQDRGVVPYADLVSTRFSNSAFHATRLDVDHIADEFNAFVTEAEGRYKLDRGEFAAKSVFVSHETFTPARGGSAAAEIESLRRTFGEETDKILITNIKGYTGHPMGAGLEDFFALKSLHNQAAPPVPNLEQPDDDLGALRYSKGEPADLDYAIRFAAGFGSQLAMALWRRRSRSEKRVHDVRHMEWLKEVTGFSAPKISEEKRIFRVSEGQPADKPAPKKSRSVTSTAAAPANIFSGDFAPMQVSLYKRSEILNDAALAQTAFKGKHALLVGASSDLQQQLKMTLETAGAKVSHMVDSSTPFDGAIAVDLGDEAAVSKSFEAMSGVDVVVNLIGLGTDPSADGAMRSAYETFHIARAWQAARGQTPGKGNTFMSLTGLGGNLGFGSSEGAPLVGGVVSGMTKGLAREWPEAQVKLIDIQPSNASKDVSLSIVSEAAQMNGRVEVGLASDGVYEFDLAPIDVTKTQPKLQVNAETVWLLTGGGRGITASIAQSLVKRFGGGHFILTGRSAFDEAAAANIDLGKEKTRIKADLKARGERVTPMAVAKALKGFEAQLDIAKTVAGLKASGATVEYLSFDVCDAASTASALATVSKSIDVCVHGAGLEDSHLLMDKDPAILDLVLRTKLFGATNLLEALGSSLKAFVGFSSVAGRFGNAGQVDYAAANDALNKLVFRLNAEGNTHAISIDWTAWADVGMATRGSIQKILEGIGVQLLPAALGSQVLGELIAAGVHTEVLVSGAMGEMAIGMNDGRHSPYVGDETPKTTQQSSFFDTVEIDKGSKSLLAKTTLNPGREAFLFDHAIDSVPVLPGVFGMELFGQAAGALVTNKTVIGFKDVVFERPVKFHRGETLTLDVEAKQVAAGIVEASLFVNRTLAKGRTTRERHFQGQVLMGKTLKKQKPSIQFGQDGLVSGPDASGIYDMFFHTGVFQVMDSIPYLSDQNVVGYGHGPSTAISTVMPVDSLCSDPFSREMALQTAGILGMREDRSKYLPAGIEKVDFFASAKPGEKVITRVQATECDEEHIRRFDVELVTEDGTLLQRLTGSRMIQAGPLPEGKQIEVTERRSTQLGRMTSVEAEDFLRGENLNVTELVSKLEYESYNRLISSDRKREWVAARVAAKLLVRAYMRDLYGVSLELPDIAIAKDEFGAPSVTLLGKKNKGNEENLPAISMTHSSGEAMVSIAPGYKYRIGLDLECIEERSEAFSEYFSDQERSLVIHDPEGNVADEAAKITALWCLKESTTKALGLGFHLALSEVLVQGLSADGRATLTLAGRAADRIAELGATHVDAWVNIRGSFCVAESIVEMDKADRKKIVRKKKNRPPTQTTLAAVAALLREKGLHAPSQGDGTFVAGTSKPGEA